MRGPSTGRLDRAEPLADPARACKGDVMRTAPAFLVGPVIAAMLVGTAMGAAAQSEEPSTPAYVTGTVLELSTETGEYVEQQAEDTVTSSDEAGVLREQGHAFGQRVEWSDPRLPSEHWIRLNLAIYGDDPEVGVMTLETSHLLVDDQGIWRGTGRAFESLDDRDSYYQLVGEGAYDGLHAFLRGTPGVDAHGPWDAAYDGWIFEGEVPGFPEPAEVVPGEGFLMQVAPDPEAIASSSAEGPADPMAPAAFVFTSEQAEEPDWGTDHESADGSVTESRAVVQVDRITATDPRASGLMTTWQNRTGVGSDHTHVQNWSITARLVNDDGAWSGPSQIIAASSDQVGGIASMTKMTGEGSYDGLTLFLHESADRLRMSSWGMIVPNELVAPMPDPVEPASE